jgi:hypothetical protein
MGIVAGRPIACQFIPKEICLPCRIWAAALALVGKRGNYDVSVAIQSSTRVADFHRGGREFGSVPALASAPD